MLNDISYFKIISLVLGGASLVLLFFVLRLRKERDASQRSLATRQKLESELAKIAKVAIAERKKFQSLFEFVPSGIFTVNKDRKITSWNRMAEEITGYKANEILGEDCALFAVEPCATRCGVFLDEVTKPGFSKGCTIRKKDGTIREILKNFDVLRDEDGEVVGGIESFQDVTEQIKLEQDRDRSQAHLMQNAKLISIGTLSAGISHEINNPLAIIKGNNMLLKDRLVEMGLKDEAVFLDKQLKAIDRVAGIVRALADYSGANTEVLERVNLHQVIEATQNLIYPVLNRELIQIELSLQATKSWVKGNRGQIQDLMMCLISNAKDAVVNNTGVKRIDVTTQDLPDGKLELLVIDNGIGIPAKLRKQIFDPFFTTKEPGKGTGLGLSIVVQVIRSLGGQITVESEEGKGTTFRVNMPSHRPDGM